MLLLSIIGYAIIAIYIAIDSKKLTTSHRIEIRRSFGRRKIYLRDRSTGRLVECSNNPFTLLMMGK